MAKVYGAEIALNEEMVASEWAGLLASIDDVIGGEWLMGIKKVYEEIERVRDE